MLNYQLRILDKLPNSVPHFPCHKIDEIIIPIANSVVIWIQLSNIYLEIQNNVQYIIGVEIKVIAKLMNMYYLLSPHNNSVGKYN